MLVLSRKLKQEIMIGENIKITVLKVKGNTVRLGIEAPREIHVVRGEIPRKSDIVGPEEAAAETTNQSHADFTVVFTNSDEDQGSKVDLIPFQRNQAEPPDAGCGKAKHNSNTTLTDSSVDSIRFRDKLPQVLQHNRLKEIVSQLTSK